MNPVAKLHQVTDTLVTMAEAQGKLDHCCKNCTVANCCDEPVMTDLNELRYALELLTTEQIEGVKQRLRVWLDKIEPSSLLSEREPSAMQWRKLKATCPLLVDGRCSVYDRRPFGCRMHFAHRNPENCAMPARTHQKYAGFPDHIMAQICAPYFQSSKRLSFGNLGVLLAEILLNQTIPSGSRQEVEIV
jgi:Fe-S-cluster containining protein